METILRHSRLFLWRFFFLYTLLSTKCSAGVHEYGVQVEPVVFLSQPQHTVITSSTLLLNCSARFTPDVNEDIPLPVISWRHNGSTINSNQRTLITINDTIGYSQLVISDIVHTDSGMYECIANDANSRYITISEPSNVIVLPLKSNVHINVSLHTYLLMDCGIPLSMNNVNEITLSWFFQNTTIISNENEWLLSNGSLLITNISTSHEGIWYCRAKLKGADALIHVSSYHIQVLPAVTEGIYTLQSSLLLVQANDTTTIIQFGNPLTLNCLFTFTEEEIEQIIWIYSNDDSFGTTTPLLVVNDLNQSNNSDSSLFIDSVSNEHIGFYMCRVLLNDGRLMSSQVFQLSTKNRPRIVSPNKTRDIYLHTSDRQYTLYCNATGSPRPIVSWYKNGDLIANNTPSVVLMASQLEYGLYGTYQCIAWNELGRDSILTRILVKGLSNPVGNVSVSPVVIGHHTTYVNISWTLPMQRGGISSLVFNIYNHYFEIFSDITEIKRHSGGTNWYLYSMNNKSPKVYKFEVEIDRPEKGLRSKRVCIDTALSYYLSEAPPSYFDCTGGNVSVRWDPPTHDLLSYPVKDVHLIAVCLYGDDIKKYEYREQEQHKVFKKFFLNFIPQGGVCQFSGRYKIPQSACNDKAYSSVAQSYHTIPVTNCTVPFYNDNNNNMTAVTMRDKEELQLNISSMTINEIKIFWSIDKEILCTIVNDTRPSVLLNVTGTCYDKGQLYKHFKFVNLTTADTKFGGFLTFTNITNQSICKFIANINEFNISSLPVQFIVGNSIPDVYKFHLPSDGSTSYDVLCDDVEGISFSSSSSFHTLPTITSSASTSNSNNSSIILLTEDGGNIITIAATNNSSSITNEGPSTMIVSFAVGFAIILSMLLLIFIVLILILRLRYRKRRIVCEVLNEYGNGNFYHSTSVIMKWNAEDNVSIKTEIQCPYYYELSSPSSCDDENNEKSENCSLKYNNDDTCNEGSDSTSFRLVRSQSMTALPDVKLWQSSNDSLCNNHLLHLPNHNDDDNNNSNNNASEVRVSENGFTFQLSIPPHGGHHEDTSACSSGYGSAISSALSHDYHESLEPELQAMKTAQVIDSSSTRDHLNTRTLPLVKRVGSCPNIIQESDYNYTDISTKNDYTDCPSVSSSETLSWDQFSSCKRSSSLKDKFPNIFIDEKGYIRFTYNNY